MLPLTVDVVDCPIELKITSKEKGMLGTLCISADGVSYKPPRTKLPPDIRLSWAMLPKMFDFAKTIGVAEDTATIAAQDEFDKETCGIIDELTEHEEWKKKRYAKAYSPKVEDAAVPPENASVFSKIVRGSDPSPNDPSH